MTTPPISLDEFETLKGVIVLGPCTITGEITDGETIDVVIRRTSTKLYKNILEDNDTSAIVSMEIQEVNPDEFR